ncbi:MAG: NADH:ubiquinone reductase (Na(+)-transporting) subunit B [Spirochaetaceae bacterium]|nr:NADH:ubiquinone reductase (Na(+)-transporting) subunit B [Spirochaetaceae bacterium]
MKFLLKQIHKNDHLFQKGGKLERLHPVWEAQNTFLFTPPIKTKNGPHVRDSIDLKRLMITVVVALVPATLFGIYNAGYQQLLAIGHIPLDAAVSALSTDQHLTIMLHGAALVLPIILVSYAVGGIWEAVFSVVRKEPISEGFLVTGLLFPLTLPATIPLWQVAIGISFGVVIGKEIFGGTGMNILNPALTARVFLFFSFPTDISGEEPWIALNNPLLGVAGQSAVDGFSGATALLVAAAPDVTNPIQAMSNFGYAGSHFSLESMFIGFIPGSIGETSTLACLIGAAILIITGVGSWQIMVSTVIGAVAMAAFLNMFAGPDLPSMLALPPEYHLVMGGFMFGTVFMTTDPVSAAQTTLGKYIYGALIGILCVLIRVWNPAYPEGMMLAILFMNIFAPLIDHYVVEGNIKRRLQRAEAK